jgi:hypothetical protein
VRDWLATANIDEHTRSVLSASMHACANDLSIVAQEVAQVESGDMPTEEEAEAGYQGTLYEQGCRFLEAMTGETRAKFFAHIKRKYGDGIR